MNRFSAGIERSTPRGLNPTIQSVFSRVTRDVSEEVDDGDDDEEEMSHCPSSRSNSGLGPVSYTTTSWNGFRCAARVWAIVFMRVSPVRNHNSGGDWPVDGAVGDDAAGHGIETRKSASWAAFSKISSLVVVVDVGVDGGMLTRVNPTRRTLVRVAPVRQYIGILSHAARISTIVFNSV